MAPEWSKIVYINTRDIWYMSTDEVIAVKARSWNKELVDTADKVLKSRKSKLLKALQTV